MRAFTFTAVWTILIDQISKYAIVEMMNLKEIGRMVVWPGLVNFHMAWNRGVNFGLFSEFDMRWVLVVLAVIVAGIVTIWVLRNPHPTRVNIAAGLLVGGAIGNVIDRLHYGAVADFLNVTCCGIRNPFAFNAADIAVFAGTIGIVFWANTQPDDNSAGKRKKL